MPNENILEEHKVNGELHKVNGPAVVYRNGICRWYVRGKWISTTRHFCKLVNMPDIDAMTMLLKYGESLIHPLDENSYVLEQLLNDMAEIIRKEQDQEIINQLVSMASLKNLLDETKRKR